MSIVSQVVVRAVQAAGSHGAEDQIRRKPRNRFSGFLLKHALADNLPPYASKYLNDGLAGDVDAASSLVTAAPNAYRGYIAVAAFFGGTPYAAYREILSAAWSHDYGCVVQAARKHRVSIRRMMRAGCFPHPFTGRVKVYRGTSGIARWKAQQGLSWTIDPDVAAWFALWHASQDRKPLVLTASVDASEFIFYDNERKEQEVIFSRPVHAVVEGDLASWRAATIRKEQQTRRDLEAYMEAISRRKRSQVPSESR